MAEYENIIVEKKTDRITYLTLNRPDKLNALNMDLLIEFQQACFAFRDDPDARVMVIKGAGRAFSSGYDMSAAADNMAGLGGDSADVWFDSMADMVRQYTDTLWSIPKAFVAQVHGYCLAGAMDLASWCDITYCADNALFGYPPVREVSIAVTSFWPYLVGRKLANEINFTGDFIEAERAYNFGMVNKVVPLAALDEEVHALAQRIALVPRQSVKYCKRFVNEIYEMQGMRTAVHLAAVYGAIEHGSPIAEGHDEFYRIQREQGLKAAYEWRDRAFARWDLHPEMRARRLDSDEENAD